MIDFGLLLSMVAAVGLPTLLGWWWPLPALPGGEDAEPTVPSFADLAVIPALAGLIVGRLVAVALDAPGSFGRLGDLLIIRSGVEFWPGAVVAVALVALEARRQGVPPLDRLAALAPAALVGYAAYEACCVFRDGCFGPAAPIGLRPPGIATTMVPIGLLVAAAVVAAAVVLHRIHRAGAPPAVVVTGAVAGVAVVRSVASIWLPHVGDGLTRPHLTSLVVAALAVVAFTVLAWGQRDRSAASVSS